jgi:long-chain acyl-CoA synthetase
MIRGDQVFKGYYKMKMPPRNARDAGYIRAISEPWNKMALFYPGPQQKRDPGSSGENIYPELVEQKLNNLPFVGEALVLERERQLHAWFIRILKPGCRRYPRNPGWRIDGK